MIVIIKDYSTKRKLYCIVVAAVYILFGVYFYHDPMILKNTNLTVEMGSHFDPYDNIQNIVFGTKKDVDIKGEVDLKKPRRLCDHLCV